jgi:hypothetical protein
MFRLPVTFATLAALGIVTSSTGHCAAITPLRLSWVLHRPAASPDAHSYMASAYDPVSNKLVIFGGYHASSYSTETWTYDGSVWTQVPTPVSPSRRAGASMAYDAQQRVLVLFGGFDGVQFLRDTWLWDGASSAWTRVDPATSRAPVSSPMLFTDPLNGHVDAYGGYDGHIFERTMFQWTGTDWLALHPSTSPSARSEAVVALDRTNHKIVMFGGNGDVNPYNTWTWDGNDWTLESPTTQPPFRYDSKAAYDPHLGHVVVFGGGNGGTYLNDTWEWTGSNWVPLQPVISPAPRWAFAMAYDENVGSIVLFGGENSSGQLADTWRLAIAP